jgi:TolB protein
MKSDGSDLKRLTQNKFNDTWPCFSADHKMIYFQSDRDGNREIYSMNSDGSSVARITNDPGNDGAPACSPDGKKILFTSTRAGNSELYLMNTDGTDTMRLTHTEHSEFNPQWAPNGGMIVYYYEKGDHKDQVYVCNADGTGAFKISDDSLNNIYPGFSPDGSEVIFQSDINEKTKVNVVDLLDQSKKEVISSGGFYNRFSPDGKYLAYISGKWPESEIYISKVDGSDKKKINLKEKILKLN